MEQVLPPVRDDLQFIPAEIQGQRVLAVKDHLGLGEGMVVLAPEVLTLLPLFDGSHTTRDLQQLLTKANGGLLVEMDRIESIVGELDSLLLLQSDRYREALQQVRATWQSLEVRPASLAGEAYPEDPEELTRFLDEILEGAGDARPCAGRIKALVAPHIDLRVGALGYAQAYGPVRDLTPSRIVVLGTGHGLIDSQFSVMGRPYQTPLGTSPTDPAAVEALITAGAPGAQDDFAHRDEHSVEFQVLFAQHLFGTRVPIVPVLVGSLHHHLDRADSPRDIAAVARFASALGDLAVQNTLVIAGVDFSHVGPKFGHESPAVSHELEFRAHDQALLAALEKGSVQQLWAEAKRAQDRWHVCGLPVLTVLLCAIEGLSGDVRHHDVWFEEPTRSAVSFAAVLLN